MRHWLKQLFQSSKPRTLRHGRRSRPALETLEDRLSPAVTSFAGGVLTIAFDAVNENVTAGNDGTNIQLFSSAAITGAGSIFTTADVTRIVVTDSGDLAGQSAEFSGNYSLPNGLSSTGVETFLFDGAFDVSGGSAGIDVTAPQQITVVGQLTTADGDITLSANQQMAPAAGTFVGISVIGATITTNGMGNLSLTGRGGSTGGGNNGVALVNGARVRSTATGDGAGTITLDGSGGTGSTSNVGVVIHNSSTQVTSVAGAIQITGHGGSGTSGSHFGVSLADTAVVSSTGADAIAATITIDATGGTGSGGLRGMSVTNGQITSVNGAIRITGQGGTGTINSNHGVLLSEAVVSSTGTGPDAATITIQGTGGSGTSENTGVLMLTASTQVTSAKGHIQITGQGGAGTGNDNIGVFLTSSATVASTGMGDGSATISINGTGGGTGGSSNGNTGVKIQTGTSKVASVDGSIQVVSASGVGDSTAIELLITNAIAVTGTAPVTMIGNSMNIAPAMGPAIAAGTNTVTLRQNAVGTAIDFGGADAAGILGLTNDELDNITAGTIAIGDENTGTITVSAAIEHAGDASFGITSGHKIVFASATGWTTAAGDLTFSANQGTVAGNYVGIDVNAATITTNGTGDIRLTGRGGDTSSSNIGIRLQAGAVVQSTVSDADAGTITLDGTGGNGTTTLVGVVITGSSTLLTSVVGAIQVTGRGGAGTGAGQAGVSVASSAVVSSTGTDANAATITLDGTGGSGTTNRFGVSVSGGQVTSVNGAIEITGQGGTGSTSGGIGVILDSGVISSTGTGTGAATITIDGTGGSGTTGLTGVQMQNAGAQVTSVDGAIQITGHGGIGTGNSNIGVFIANGPVVSSTGTGDGAATITIVGTGGGTGGSSSSNTGVRIPAATAQVTSVDGRIAITGTAGVGTSTAIELQSSDDITVTGTASVLLTGDSMNISAANAIAAGANEVTLRLQTDGNTIDVGGVDAAGILGLTNDELSNIVAGTIHIGDDDNSGSITVSAPITFSNPGGDGPDLTLDTDGTINGNATFDTDGGDLLFNGSSINALNGLMLTTNTSGKATFTGGTLEVGASPGTLTIGGPLAFTSTHTYHAEINGPTPGTDFDQITANNGVTLGNAILDLDIGFTPAVGQSFTLIANVDLGAVAGTFAGLPEGAVLGLNGLLYQISYTGGADDNDVVLTRMPPPAVNLVVNNPGDGIDGDYGPGQLTLREAILLANALPDENTITFDLPPGSTITLTNGELQISEDLNIEGPGASVLTISGNNLSRIFADGSMGSRTVSISGLTLTRGNGIGARQNTTGGAVMVENDSWTITDSVLTGNAGQSGGAIGNVDGEVTLRNSTLSNNTASSAGGAIFNRNGVLRVFDSILSDNHADSNNGGAIYNFGGSTLEVENSTLSDNTARFGGALYSDDAGSKVTVRNSTLSNNTAGNFAGAIWNGNFSMLLVESSTLSGNTATGFSGGGIYNRGDATATVRDSTLSDNKATGTGGGIHNEATVTLINSTVSGNKSAVTGGGIHNSGSLTSRNSTITGNQADIIADGGAEQGGGIMSTSANTILHNTIVAGNVRRAAVASDIQGMTVDAGSSNNLIGDANSSGGLTHDNNGNLVGNAGTGTRDIDTILNPMLAFNGGPTQTHALPPGSLAIDAGGNALALAGDGVTPLAFDQRGAGFARIAGGRVDIGAVEHVVRQSTSAVAAEAQLRLYRTITNRRLRANRRRGLLQEFGRAAGRRVKVQLVRGPEVGKLRLRKNGSFVYTPPRGFTGQATFVVRRFDGAGLDEQLTVVLNVNPRPRVFSVVPGQTLEISAADGLLRDVQAFERQPVAVELVDGPRRGQLELKSNGAFTFVVPANFQGRVSFRYRLLINGVAGAVGRVTLTTRPHPLAERAGPAPA